MIPAGRDDKEHVVEILSRSFDENRSVNYIIPQDARRKQRVRALMDYSFETCSAFGKVFLSEDRNGCALVLFPDQKKTTLKSIYQDLMLIASCIGLSHAGKALDRESRIKKLQRPGPLYYLWFIGVLPEAQRQGTGSRLLEENLRLAQTMGRAVCLETSTVRNLPWYERFGFEVYARLDLGYTLYFLKKKHESANLARGEGSNAIQHASGA